MCDEDVEAVDHVNEWRRLVFLPLLHSLSRLDDDDEIILLTLEVDLGDASVSAHCVGIDGDVVLWLCRTVRVWCFVVGGVPLM
jgi:hypothetical protein